MTADKNMASGKFTRVKEDFKCGKCGTKVTGGGYTNHCPQCLWSRHVDVNPGDRASECRGFMRPILSRVRRDEYSILQRCENCALEKWNKTAPADCFDIILKLSVNKKVLGQE